MKYLTTSTATAALLLISVSDAAVLLLHHQKRASCSDDCASFEAIFGTCETKSIPLNSDGTSQGPDAINFTVWAQCICTQAGGQGGLISTCSTCPQAGTDDSFNSKVFTAVCDTYSATNASAAGQQWQTCYRNDTCPSSNSSSSSSSGSSSTSDAVTLQQSNSLLCLSLLLVLTTYAAITQFCLL